MDRPEQPARDDRTDREDIAFLLPFFGVLLLTPPLLNLVVGGVAVFGVPLEVVYLFAVWVLVVAGAGLLSRRPPFRGGPPVAARRERSAAPGELAGAISDEPSPGEPSHGARREDG